MSDVVGSESALLNQNNQQQQAGQLGTAITSGAFGGDRAGIAAANLAGQQNLTNANIYSNLLNQGYNTALSTAQQQQGVDLSAAQANRSAIQQTGQALQGLGTASQTAGLAGAAAQTNAGSLEQQTQQAQDAFNVQQYLAQQSLPYQQLAQQANIAEGTGSLSGSTTTTNSVANGIFSDERLKDDIHEIGKTFDGQKIYSYRYKGQPHHHIGLMAGEVQHKHPEAVGLASGFKTVDYKKATGEAAKRGHFADGGAPYEDNPALDIMGQKFQQMYGSLLQPHGPMVPAQQGGGYQLHPATGGIPQQPSPVQTANQYADLAKNINGGGHALGLWGGSPAPNDQATALGTPTQFDPATQAQSDAADQYSIGDALGDGQKRGGRIGLAMGGDLPYSDGADSLDVPDDNQHYTLATAGQAPAAPKDNTIQDIGQVAQIAGMFFAHGGRIQRADGGGVDDISPEALLKMLKDEYGRQEAASNDEKSTTPNPMDTDDAPADDDNVFPSGTQVRSALGTPAPSAKSGKGTIADRNNNPGNIEDGKLARSMPGYAGSDGRFAKFESHEAGRAAQMALLQSYVARGYDTPLKLASRWAPAGDGNNNPERYAKVIGAPLGLGLNDKITPDKLAGLAVAQGKMEGYHRKGFADGSDVSNDPTPATDGSDISDDDKRKMFAQFDTSIAAPQTKAALATPLATADAAPPAPSGPQSSPQESDSAWSPEAAPQILQKYVNKTPDYYGSGQAQTDGNFADQVKHGKTDAILSILSGLGAAATANTNNPLTAIFTGLGAGAQAYQGQRQFEQERTKAAQDLALQRGKLGIEGALASGELSMTPAQIYELQQRGLFTGTQSATALAKLPYAGPLAAAQALRERREAMQTGRSYQAPAGPGAGAGVVDTGSDKPGYTPIIPYGLPPQPGQPNAPTGGAQASSAGQPSPVAGSPTTPPKQSGNWSGVDTPTSVPKPPANFWVNGGMERYRADAADQIKTLRDRSEHAQQALTLLQQLKEDFAALPESGLQTPGAGGERGLSIIRKLNGAASWLGLPQVQSTSVPEHLEKIARSIAAGTAADMHEGRGVGVLDLALKRNPTMANTKAGALDILNSMIENEKRVGLRDKYFNNWIQNPNSFGTVLGAQEQFERDNKPEYFSARAHKQTIMDTAAPEDIADLRKNPKAAWRAFDKQYGPGSAALIVGKKAIGG